MVRVITLTTDFGPSEYVAQMKGVLVSHAPEVQLVDVAHDVSPQNVVEGAYVLWSACEAFPPDSIHLAVVDPGVGTDRRGLVIECERGTLVGPDNGLLMPAARRLGLQRVVAIPREAFAAPRVSPTLHSRDVFAPMAARLASGLEPARVGPVVKSPVDIEFFDATRRGRGEQATVDARVLRIDRFGNAITNVSAKLLKALGVRPQGALKVRVGGVAHELRLVPTYGSGKPRELLAVIGSSGLLEIALRDGSAAERLSLAVGARLRVEPGKTGRPRRRT